MRLGLLSYINSLPVTFGLECGAVPFEGSLQIAEPFQLNQAFAKGELDLTAVSSVEYLLHGWPKVPGLCLACDGPVMSVRLFSRVPREELQGQKVWLTEASATSRALLLALLPNIVAFDAPGLPVLDNRCQAVLRIGDRALEEVEGAHYVYDLGQWWREETGLPMVFAVWVARNEPSEAALLLQESLAWGRAHPDRLLAEARRRTGLPESILKDYFGCLYYQFDERTRQGLAEFQRRVKERICVNQ